jgi:hypothetical protein
MKAIFERVNWQTIKPINSFAKALIDNKEETNASVLEEIRIVCPDIQIIIT